MAYLGFIGESAMISKRYATNY